MYLYFNLSQTDVCDVELAFRCEDYVFIPFHMKLQKFLHSRMFSSIVLSHPPPTPPN